VTHTPGPWLAHFSPNTGWSVWHDPRQHGDMRTGAIIVAGEVGPQATSYKTHRMRKANALLIAAAPDMLGELTHAFDLLQTLSAYIPAHGAKMLEEYQSRAVAIRAAITKATTPTDSNTKEEST
jgi:hypothetical protein